MKSVKKFIPRLYILKRLLSMNRNICFVTMPDFSFRVPSLSLSLLKAILKRSGISSEIFYGPLIFREYCNSELLQIISEENRVIKRYMIEWLFSYPLFPEQEDTMEWYIDFLHRTDLPSRNLEDSKIKEMFLDFRSRMLKFLSESAEKILLSNPSIVGCTCLGTQYFPSLAILKTIHNIAPEVITLMGGPFFEPVTAIETHRTFSWIDYIVLGEADDIISPLVTSIMEKGRNMTEEEVPEGVIGPVYRNKGYNEKKVKVLIKESLEDLPLPDYTDFFKTLSKLSSTKNLYPALLCFESSRGCFRGEKVKCTFCGENNSRQKYRQKSAAMVLEEFKLLKEHYGISFFSSNDSVLSVDYFKTLFPELIKTGSPYELFYQTRPDLTMSQIKILSDAGVNRIQPGIESLDTGVLKLMKKGVESWKNIQLLKGCLYYGIHTAWPYLYGFPGEQDLWYEETVSVVQMIFHLCPPFNIQPVHFCRNSIYFEEEEKYDLKIKPDSIYSHILPLPEETIRNIACYFSDLHSLERRKDDLESLYNTGLNSLKKEIKKWDDLFWSTERPLLEMSVMEDRLEIKDTRPCAVKEFHIFTNLFYDLYLYCDEAPLKINVMKNFKEKGFTEDTIESVIKTLLCRKVMIDRDGRLISLAVKKPLRIMADKKVIFLKYTGQKDLIRHEGHML